MIDYLSIKQHEESRFCVSHADVAGSETECCINDTTLELREIGLRS